MPNEVLESSLGTNGSGAAFIAPVMHFAKDDFKGYKGGYDIKQIDNIQFALSAVNSITKCDVFIFVSRNEEAFEMEIAQNVPNFVENWNKVMLNTPFEITDDISDILVGYAIEFKAPAFPAFMTSPSVDKQNLFFWSMFDTLRDYNGSFLVKMGATAESDLPMKFTFKKFNFPPFVGLGTSFPFTFEVENSGGINITSMEISYKMGDEPEEIVLLTDDMLAIPTITSVLTVSDVNVPTSQQAQNTYPVTFKILKINGEENPHSNDVSNSSYFVLPKFVQRIVLHEGFTSSTCPPCKQGNENVKAVQSANTDKYASIKYQVQYPGTGDPYATTGGNTRMNYYSVNAVPWFFANGNNWSGNSMSYRSTLLNAIYVIPAFASFSNVNAAIDGQKIYFHIVIEPLIPTTDNIRLFAAIVEKRTTKNAKTNGETEFENVTKKFLTPETGTPVGELQPEDTKIFDLEWEFQGNYRLPSNGQTNNIINDNIEHSVEDFDNLAVVYWLQNYSDKTVFQSGIIDVFPSSIKEYTLINSIYPNPTKGDIAIELKEDAKVTIWNIEGNKLYECEQTEGISNIKLNATPGSYILKTENKNGSHSTKFIIE